jgi:hypothetical protein
MGGECSNLIVFMELEHSTIYGKFPYEDFRGPKAKELKLQCSNGLA